MILTYHKIHPENKTGKNRQFLFENNVQSIYPDFISKTEPKSVGDAKYIPLGGQQSYAENTEKATSIYYKTITYMYRFKSNHGFLLFPNQETSFFESYRIKETDGILEKIGLAIPQTSENFNLFIKTMNLNEQKMRQILIADKITIA